MVRISSRKSAYLFTASRHARLHGTIIGHICKPSRRKYTISQHFGRKQGGAIWREHLKKDDVKGLNTSERTFQNRSVPILIRNKQGANQCKSLPSKSLLAGSRNHCETHKYKSDNYFMLPHLTTKYILAKHDKMIHNACSIELMSYKVIKFLMFLDPVCLHKLGPPLQENNLLPATSCWHPDSWVMLGQSKYVIVNCNVNKPTEAKTQRTKDLH